MARGFAEQSGSALRIESAPGSGTTVTLWLPVADGTPGRPARPEHVARPPGAAALRILLVDDEDLVREVLAQHLSDRDYAVVQASEGATALALLEAGELVDALVSDLPMPRMNGVALIREAQRRRPGLPAVLLTGFAGEEAELEARGVDDGGFGIMRKPVSGADLAGRRRAPGGGPEDLTARRTPPGTWAPNPELWDGPARASSPPSPRMASVTTSAQSALRLASRGAGAPGGHTIADARSA